MSSPIRVFLYGTLKRGQPNYHWLTNSEHGTARYLYDAISVEKFPLIIASRFNIPFLLNFSGKGHQIKGEVFEIDEKMLRNLDKLEDYPTLYDREMKCVIRKNEENKEEIVECVTYWLKKCPERLLTLEFMDEYKDTPEKPYGPDEIDDFTYEELLREVT